jgi:hypothetical protein
MREALENKISKSIWFTLFMYFLLVVVAFITSLAVATIVSWIAPSYLTLVYTICVPWAFGGLLFSRWMLNIRHSRRF